MAIDQEFKGAAFEPEAVCQMALAFEYALVLLGLKKRNDSITEMIAKHIINVAEDGEKDPEKICALALRRLNNADRKAS